MASAICRDVSSDEVLISCHACHPSLANDNLSGLSVATFLAQFLSGQDLRYSYRFLFIPGTIGAITWLARNREHVERIRHGLVLTGIGDAGGFHYKKSRRGNAEIDQAVAHVLRHQSESARDSGVLTVRLRRAAVLLSGLQSSGRLPDAKCLGNLSRVSHFGGQSRLHPTASWPNRFAFAPQSSMCWKTTGRYCNLNPYCEPQLGKRNLYRSTGGEAIGTGDQRPSLGVESLRWRALPAGHC